MLSKDTKEEGKGEREGETAETLTNHGRYLLSFTGCIKSVFCCQVCMGPAETRGRIF